MRLDKFLKISRLVKQRHRAKSLCDNKAVSVNDSFCKPSYQVRVGDILKVIVGDRQITAEIVDTPYGNVSKSRAREVIEIKKEVWLDETR